MIGFNDKSLLISTPTKCGTERLVRALVTMGKCAHVLPTKHGYSKYSEYKTRILLVRDPLERWVSTFWWMKGAFKKYCADHFPVFESFQNFTEFIATTDSNASTCRSLSLYVTQFQPDKIIRTEDLNFQDRWPIEFRGYTWKAYQEANQHKTRNRKSVSDTLSEQKLGEQFIALLQQEYVALGEALYAFPNTLASDSRGG